MGGLVAADRVSSKSRRDCSRPAAAPEIGGSSKDSDVSLKGAALYEALYHVGYDSEGIRTFRTIARRRARGEGQRVLSFTMCTFMNDA